MDFDLSVSEDVQEDKDVLGGGSFVWDSNIYPTTVDMAYLSEAASGAVAMNFVFKDEGGRKLKQTIYITSGNEKGKKTYYINKNTGKKHNLPGFTTVYNIIAITLNTDLNSAVNASQKKTLMLYDFDAGGEVATEVEHVLVDMIGKKVVLGVKKILENKKQKGDDGKYHAIAETREINEIATAFFPDSKLTVSEKKSGLTEPDFYDKWLDKYEGDVHDKTEKVAGGANTPTATGNVAPQNKLF